MKGQLGLVLAVGFELIVVQAEFGRDVADVEHLGFLGDGDVGLYGRGHVALLAYL